MEAQLRPNEICGCGLLPQMVEGLLQCQPFLHVYVIDMPAIQKLTPEHYHIHHIVRPDDYDL